MGTSPPYVSRFWPHANFFRSRSRGYPTEPLGQTDSVAVLKVFVQMILIILFSWSAHISAKPSATFHRSLGTLDPQIPRSFFSSDPSANNPHSGQLKLSKSQSKPNKSNRPNRILKPSHSAQKINLLPTNSLVPLSPLKSQAPILLPRWSSTLTALDSWIVREGRHTEVAKANVYDAELEIRVKYKNAFEVLELNAMLEAWV